MLDFEKRIQNSLIILQSRSNLFTRTFAGTAVIAAVDLLPSVRFPIYSYPLAPPPISSL